MIEGLGQTDDGLYTYDKRGMENICTRGFQRHLEPVDHII